MNFTTTKGERNGMNDSCFVGWGDDKFAPRRTHARNKETAMKVLHPNPAEKVVSHMYNVIITSYLSVIRNISVIEIIISIWFNIS